MRERLEGFYEEIAALFEERNVQVVRAPFCRLKAEFGQTIQEFEVQNVDAVVTLHMAYSPSLESIDALAETQLWCWTPRKRWSSLGNRIRMRLVIVMVFMV